MYDMIKMLVVDINSIPKKKKKWNIVIKNEIKNIYDMIKMLWW